MLTCACDCESAFIAVEMCCQVLDILRILRLVLKRVNSSCLIFENILEEFFNLHC